MGGTVPGLLVLAASVAVFGGMFAASSPPPAVASAAKREAVLPKVPAQSGHGRRIVFDQSAQRVWLVASGGDVERSYLVTGSKWDNLRPGAYRVNSKTRQARTYRGGGTFEYFVKFAQGRSSAIGFHAVTVRNNGTTVYTRADLGTARTPGCVEAMREDARALWEFAPVGTPVVVTA
jgi:lipoprotein-anchoring transpeptidase ErfK/SrfK